MSPACSTHDQDEPSRWRRVVVMTRGRIGQVGTPEEVYERAGQSFVYNCLGNVKLFTAG